MRPLLMGLTVMLLAASAEASIKSFRESLDKAGAKHEFVSYPGVVHSFTVPVADARNLPGMKYDKQSDEDSWSRMTKLFAEQFGK